MHASTSQGSVTAWVYVWCIPWGTTRLLLLRQERTQAGRRGADAVRSAPLSQTYPCSSVRWSVSDNVIAVFVPST